MKFISDYASHYQTDFKITLLEVVSEYFIHENIQQVAEFQTIHMEFLCIS